MPFDINTLLQPVQLGTESYIPLTAYLREIFINEAPLLNRLPREGITNESYNIITYDVRPRVLTLNGAIGSTGATSIVLTDATSCMPGDVLEIFQGASGSSNGNYERVEVQAVNLTGDFGLVGATNDGVTVTVRRAVEGTSGITNDLSSGVTLTVNLIGNSRTGSEIQQQGNRAVRTAIPQQVQTYQFSVTMGGKAQAVRTVALPSGVPSIFSLEQTTKVTEMERDIEYGFYYGIGDRPASAGDRAKQAGLRKLIGYYKSGANITLNAGSSFTRNNLYAATVQKAIDGGGHPDIMVVSTNFLSFIQTWTAGAQFYMNEGYTQLGVGIESFQSAFIGRPMQIIPSYQLRPGTAICLTSSDLKVRELRPERWVPRAVLGDAMMGDFMGDVCIEIGHPGWHAYVESITSVA